jgi:hypothetical protein
MRTYPTDSPEAAARIVSLALVADGNVSQDELDVLERAGAYAALGLDRTRMRAVLQDFCEDLMHSQHGQWSDASQIDSGTLHQLMAEVVSPALRLTVLNLCVKIAEVDDHIADGEARVLTSAVEQWGLQREMLAPSHPA